MRQGNNTMLSPVPSRAGIPQHDTCRHRVAAAAAAAAEYVVLWDVFIFERLHSLPPLLLCSLRVTFTFCDLLSVRLHFFTLVM